MARTRNPATGRYESSVTNAHGRAVETDENGWPVGAAAFTMPRQQPTPMFAKPTPAERYPGTPRRIVALAIAATVCCMIGAIVSAADPAGYINRAASYVGELAGGTTPALAASESPAPQQQTWLLHATAHIGGFDNDMTMDTGGLSECIAIGERMRIAGLLASPDNVSSHAVYDCDLVRG